MLVSGPGDHGIPGAVAVVSPALLVEAGRRFRVPGQVVRLEVRALVLARADAEPGHGADDAVGPLGPVAGGVGVLDAQHQRAALMPGEGPVEQNGPGTAHMEHAGWRWCEPCPHRRTRASHGCRV